MQYATKEDIDAEFPHVTPLHRRVLFAKIQELKTHQRRRAESKDTKQGSDSKDTKSKESDSKESKPTLPPVNFDEYSGHLLIPKMNFPRMEIVLCSILFWCNTFRVQWLADSYTGVSINREKAWLTFGKNDHIKMFNTADGTLKIMATKVDFLTKSLTVSERKFTVESMMQIRCHILNALYVQLQNCFLNTFSTVS